MADRLHLVAYDVRCPRRLAAARRAVTAWAHGGQRSVWECRARPGEREALLAAMAAPLDLRVDSLALFDLPPSGPFIAMGRGRPPVGGALVYVG
jgi:CRISPR-associated protein Cas2